MTDDAIEAIGVELTREDVGLTLREGSPRVHSWVTDGVDTAWTIMLDRDVMTVAEVTVFGGVYNMLVPAVAVLLTA